jgi:hypothetical protein
VINPQPCDCPQEYICEHEQAENAEIDRIITRGEDCCDGSTGTPGVDCDCAWLEPIHTKERAGSGDHDGGRHYLPDALPSVTTEPGASEHSHTLDSEAGDG